MFFVKTEIIDFEAPLKTKCQCQFSFLFFVNVNEALVIQPSAGVCLNSADFCYTTKQR